MEEAPPPGDARLLPSSRGLLLRRASTRSGATRPEEMRTVTYSPQRIVITGGAGFIGSHLADHLLRSIPGCSVVLADRFTNARAHENVRSALATGRGALARVDILDTAALLSTFRGADVVIHAAAETDMRQAISDPRACRLTNTHGTQCVLEACVQARVDRVLFISTQMVYGVSSGRVLSESDPIQPSNPYGESKAAAELVVQQYHQAYGLDVRVVRPNNVIGSRQQLDKVVPRFIHQMLQDEPLTVFDNGTLCRSYLMVEDFCTAAVVVISRAETSAILNVGCPEEYTNLAIAEMICHAFGRCPEEWIHFVPGHPCKDFHYRLDTSRLRSLGWSPRASLRSELPRIIEWYRADRAAKSATPSILSPVEGGLTLPSASCA